MKLVLVGIQGAGKSTQGNLLADYYGVPYLSSGHIFRSIAREKNALGRYIKEVMSAGMLIPDEKTTEIVMDYLNRDEYQKGYILDGFPRTVPQAKDFQNGLEAVVHLNISDKEALWRIAGRIIDGQEIRDDETLPAIRRRIEQFHEHTEPVIEYYRQKGLLEEIDGEKGVQEIFNEIVRRLDAKA